MDLNTLKFLEKNIQRLSSMIPRSLMVKILSRGRLNFLEIFEKESPESIIVPENLKRTIWGIDFRSQIMNAAGMFKNGECYGVISQQGAGGFLGGTSTWDSRKGNKDLPFAKLSHSSSALNCLGLPNKGDIYGSNRVAELIESGEKSQCPIGWSVSYSPGKNPIEKSKNIVSGMELYEATGVDFLEVNESCPNTGESSGNLEERLKFIRDNFLKNRKRNFPVIVKFSNDTEIEQVHYLLDLLFDFGFDGVNFGNTSTDYSKHRKNVDEKDRKLFDYFVKNIGGGVSGKVLKQDSLKLCSEAVKYVKLKNPKQEFHVIRTGGIETAEDILESEKAGISLNQWFTGYWENFSKEGHKLYEKLYQKLI